jgi:hypothetical protein
MTIRNLSPYIPVIMTKLNKYLLTVVLFLPFLLMAQEQLTNLPTLYITTDSTYANGTKVPIQKEVYFSGSLRIVAGNETPGQYDSTIQIRGRGNSTWNLAKKPYRIKLDKKTRLLGMTAKENDWVLLANHADKTLVRNALAFEISKACNIYYTPDYRFVDVILNGNYIGNYMLTDQVERDKDRVNTEKMDTSRLDPNLTGGYVLEIDGFGITGSYDPGKGELFPEAFSSNIGNKVTIKYPDNDEITAAQRQYIIQHYNTFEQSILNYNNTQAAYENICRYLDTTAFVNWYIANELTANPDGVWSIFMKKHRDDDRLYFGPLWDNDISFGNCNRIYSLANDGRSESIMLKCFSNNRVKELINKVLTISPIRKMIAERWKVIYQNEMLKDDLIHLLYNMEEELDASQKLNYQKWSTALSSRIYNEIYYGSNISFAMQMEYLRNYLSERIDFLDSFFSAMANEGGIDPEDPPLPPVDTATYFSPEPYVWYHLQCQLNDKYLVCQELAGGYQLGYTYDPETAGDWAKFEISCSKDDENRSVYYLRNKAAKTYVYINAAKAAIPLDPVQKTFFTLYPSPNEAGHYGLMVLSDNSTLHELGIDANDSVVSWPTLNKKGQREYRFIPDRSHFQSVFDPPNPQQALWDIEENWDNNIPNAYATAIIAEGAKLELSQDETVTVDSLIILPGAEVLNYGTIRADVSLFCSNDSLSASYDYSQETQLISERVLYRSFNRSQSWYALSLPLDVKSVRNKEMTILQPGKDYYLMEYKADSNRFDSLSLAGSFKPKAGPYLFSVSPEREQQAFVFVFDTKSSYQTGNSDYSFTGNTGFKTINIPAAGTYLLEDHLHFVLQEGQQLLLPAFHAYFSVSGDRLPDSLAIYNMNPANDTLTLENISKQGPLLVSRAGLLIIFNMEAGEDFSLFKLDGRLLLRDKALNNPTYVPLKQGIYLLRYKKRFHKIHIP